MTQSRYAAISQAPILSLMNEAFFLEGQETVAGRCGWGFLDGVCEFELRERGLDGICVKFVMRMMCFY